MANLEVTDRESAALGKPQLMLHHILQSHYTVNVHINETIKEHLQGSSRLPATIMILTLWRWNFLLNFSTSCI